MKVKDTICLTLTFFSILLTSSAQVIKAKWTNKNNGTYTIYPHYMGQIKDSTICGVGIKFFELAKDGLKNLEGIIKINGKKYRVYDSTGFVEEDGQKNPFNYFGIYLTSGDFTFKAIIDKNYYPIKTEKLFLRAKNSYEFHFYFIRKDELKELN